MIYEIILLSIPFMGFMGIEEWILLIHCLSIPFMGFGLKREYERWKKALFQFPLWGSSWNGSRNDWKGNKLSIPFMGFKEALEKLVREPIKIFQLPLWGSRGET